MGSAICWKEDTREIVGQARKVRTCRVEVVEIGEGKAMINWIEDGKVLMIAAGSQNKIIECAVQNEMDTFEKFADGVKKDMMNLGYDWNKIH